MRDGLLKTGSLGMGPSDRRAVGSKPKTRPYRWIDMSGQTQIQIDRQFIEASAADLIREIERGRLGGEWMAKLTAERDRLANAFHGVK